MMLRILEIYTKQKETIRLYRTYKNIPYNEGRYGHQQ